MLHALVSDLGCRLTYANKDSLVEWNISKEKELT
jgi:hypothetical protein